MLRRLAAAATKETRLIFRDVHGLALLFVLPLVFILVMSLALQDAFASHGGRGIPVLVIDADGTEDSADLIRRMSANPAFTFRSEVARSNQAAGAAGVRFDLDDSLRFVVEVPRGYSDALVPETDARPPEVRLTVSPRVDRRIEIIFLSTVREALGRHRVDAMLEMVAEAEGARGDDTPDSSAFDTPVAVAYAREEDAAERPSAVQQNVPAWLVFSIFFVAIPFSNTFITERERGVQRRLRTTQMGAVEQFAGKIAPYFLINMIQTAMMFAVGIWLVPVLGGDALALRGDPLALVLVAAAVSLAARSFALVISVIARTTEQATLMTGVGNILLAAIGGVMAPRFIMPDVMQQLSSLSPMAWGLDGFLALLLDDGGIRDVAGNIARLGAFSVSMLGLAWLIQRTRT